MHCSCLTIILHCTGELQTYWLVFKQSDSVSMSSGRSTSESEQNVLHPKDELQESGRQQPMSVPLPVGMQEHIAPVKLSKKAERLVDWNEDILSRLLRQIVARREADGGKTLTDLKLARIEHDLREKWSQGTVMDEVKEIIQLPKYDNAAALKKEEMDASGIKLRKVVREQLRTYVATVAGMYREKDSVPFHNFEHASHVTMSVVKLLTRIVAPKSSDGEGDFNKELHDHTYGIASDPLTQFSVVLSALMHDADHVGTYGCNLLAQLLGVAQLLR